MSVGIYRVVLAVKRTRKSYDVNVSKTDSYGNNLEFSLSKENVLLKMFDSLSTEENP